MTAYDDLIDAIGAVRVFRRFPYVRSTVLEGHAYRMGSVFVLPDGIADQVLAAAVQLGFTPCEPRPDDYPPLEFPPTPYDPPPLSDCLPRVTSPRPFTVWSSV